ncbi:GGDEF domain-containing protein [Alteromonas facilis]|uniref:transporter substrate-binding domain-containing diguanylate cyclase n=1 Tax=Alteromonas facilis TaxID=2048004 RepID=UPI000C289159|nr:GGDEF domain-containing protein [Alteromonas facilis]
MTHFFKLIFTYVLGCTVAFLTVFSVQAQVSNAQDRVTLHYCVDPDWMPYEAIRNGVHVGISADYLQLLSELANIEFVLEKTESWTESLRKVAAGTCDLIPMLNRTPQRESSIAFTDTFFTSSNVMVAPSSSTVIQGYEAITDQVLGVVKGYRHSEYIQRYYPNIALQQFDTERDVLWALSEGKIDLAVGSLLAVNAMIQNNGLTNIQVIGLAQPHDQLRVGVSRRLNKIINDEVVSARDILDRLNDAIRQIPETEHVNIYRQWNNVKYIEHTDYKMFVWPVVLLLIIISAIVWRNRSINAINRALSLTNSELERLQTELVEKNRSLEFLSIHDHLTGLYNRNFMLQRAEEAVNAFERFKQPVCIMVMDVDHFKAINDRFGHAVGDKILIELTRISQGSLREVDLIARWGGEEFLILCPNTTEGEAKVLAERIRTSLAKTRIAPLDGPITCSFGVAEIRSGDDFTTWFDNADRCMFNAKREGRNRIVGLSDAR